MDDPAGEKCFWKMKFLSMSHKRFLFDRFNLPMKFLITNCRPQTERALRAASQMAAVGWAPYPGRRSRARLPWATIDHPYGVFIQRLRRITLNQFTTPIHVQFFP
jgi:hypothetical protein